MPKVKLINYTKDALETLLYTKNTRLKGAKSFDDIKSWPMEEKLDHLNYMRDTIQSSWEFVDFTFKISEVDRAFTHQLVRTRTGSYAQQSQRTVDVRDAGYTEISDANYLAAVENSFDAYKAMVDSGVEIQEARGVLPTCCHTEIIAKFNLRTLHDMALVRLCKRTQGQYQDVFKLMKAAVVAVYPWADDFIKVACAWNGVCVFPRYKKCPVQRYTIKATDEELNKIQEVWENTVHIANPIAKNGVTM